jgi:PAS domain S-box-containing protein
VVRAGDGGQADESNGLAADGELPEFDQQFRGGYARGHTLIVEDVPIDDRFTATQRELYAAASVGALVAVMLERGGRIIGGLTVHNAVPRRWTSEEVALIRDVASRVAVAVDRAYSESTLRASEEQYRHIVEGARDYAIIMTDLEGRIQTWSPGAEAVLGWTAYEARGQPAAMIYTPEDRAEQVPERELRQAIATGSAPDRRWHLRKDGERVYLDGTARAMTNRAGEVTKVLKIGQDVTERRRMEQALHDLNQSLEARVRDRTAQLEEAGRVARERDATFRRRVTQAEESERRRLARDLHDEAGQLLTALGLGLKAVFDVAPLDSELSRRTEKLRELADTLGRELHGVAVRLRPKALDDFGLEAALNNYAEEWKRMSGIELAVHAPENAPRLPEPVETAIYRIVQEALTNVARHSGATHASVLVERRGGEVVTVIEDDGRGIDPAMLEDAPNAGGLGLPGIRERAELLGGTAEIESSQDSGTTVFVRIPIVSDVPT